MLVRLKGCLGLLKGCPGPLLVIVKCSKPQPFPLSSLHLIHSFFTFAVSFMLESQPSNDASSGVVSSPVVAQSCGSTNFRFRTYVPKESSPRRGPGRPKGSKNKAQKNTKSNRRITRGSTSQKSRTSPKVHDASNSDACRKRRRLGNCEKAISIGMLPSSRNAIRYLL